MKLPRAAGVAQRPHRRGGLPAGAALAAVLALGVCAGGPAAAYEVHAVDGRVLPVDVLAVRAGQFVLVKEDESVALAPEEIDFYRTFVANLGEESGNILVFQNGRFLRFERLELADGRATVHVGGGAFFSIEEGLIDFEATVLEGAMVQLPKDARAGLAVAKDVPDGRSSQRQAAAEAARERLERLRERRERARAARERLRQRRAAARGDDR